MTGRELVIYILQNNLLDELVFDDGKILGFITIEEAAAKMGVGVATVRVWINQDRLKAVTIGNSIYIPANFKSPMEEVCTKKSKSDSLV